MLWRAVRHVNALCRFLQLPGYSLIVSGGDRQLFPLTGMFPQLKCLCVLLAGPPRSFGTLVVYNGNIYGTTQNGGTHGYGTVFELLPSLADTITTVVNFDGNIGEGDSIVGALPVAGLLRYNGVFYGTTYRGGPSNVGTVFKIVSN
jgi:uncharacterized repeat protein (TIGR03803 family)